MARAEAGERKGGSRVGQHQLGRSAIGSVPHQDISRLERQERKAFSLMVVTDLHPSQLACLQGVGTMQAPGVSLGSHLREMGRIHQQNALLRRQGPDAQAQIQHLREEPEQPRSALPEAFVPCLARSAPCW
jgi:hypothetical protein